MEKFFCKTVKVAILLILLFVVISFTNQIFAASISNLNDIKRGSQLKLKNGYVWCIFDNNSYNNISNFLPGGTKITIKEVVSDERFKIDYDGKTNKYIKIGEGSLKYFEKVETGAKQENLKVSSKWKLKSGYVWCIFDSSSYDEVSRYMIGGTQFTITQIVSNGRYKISYNGSTERYIKIESENALNYFEKVSASSNNNNNNNKNNKIDVKSINISATSTSINVGKTTTVKVIFNPTNATNKNVTYTSSNTSVATVNSNGVVTGKSAGTVTITAKSNNGKTAKCSIKVVATQKSSNPQTNISWTKAYLTGFWADESGGENYSTATVSNLIVRKNGTPVPNSSKHASKSEEGVVTYYGYHVLGTTNRSVFPLGSVIEYKVGGKTFRGVVLDHNGDNNAGRQYVTIDHLFCTASEANKFINKYTTNYYLPVADARIIGTMNLSTGKVTLK